MIGKTIFHYKILEKLGEGGMGVVYKAQDTRLDRFVALKFLPSQLIATKVDKTRFIQEAKAASAINHPNVCTIYDIQESDGQLFIVMEFIDGKTLKDKKDNLSEKQKLEIGIQIAEGLAAAHEKGIVHRDIKPENIMIRKDGIVHIMDFGVAKVHTTAGVSRITKIGTTMGTLSYMSPEQVQGLDVDFRTDIFSLGVILYELFADESPYKGIHETALMYEIVNTYPEPISAINPEINPEIDLAILECLEKDPSERFQSAAEIARQLRRLKPESGKIKTNRNKVYSNTVSNISEKSKNSDSVDGSKKSSYKKIFLAASFLFVILFSVLITKWFLKEPVKEVRKYQLPAEYNFFVLSPDGKKVAYSKGNKLWIRYLNNSEPLEINNNKFVANILWSPNSSYIAYYTTEGNKHQLRRVSVNGTEDELIFEKEGNYFPKFWGFDDSILVNTWSYKTAINTILKVSADGGELKPILGGNSPLDTIKGNLSHVMELPDSKTLLLSNNTFNDNFIYTGSEIILQTNKKRTVIYNGPNRSFIGKPVYSNKGYILFPTHQLFRMLWDIMAIPFDLSSMKVSGNTFLVVRGANKLCVSQNGMLSYVKQNVEFIGQRLVMLTRSGEFIRNISQPKIGLGSPSFSPDGKTIVATCVENVGKFNLWLFDVSKNLEYQFTYGIQQAWEPSWSPDGKQIVFASGLDQADIYLQSTNGGTPAKPLIHTNKFEGYPNWSPSGKYILYTVTETQPLLQNDIWYLEVGNGKSPKPLFKSEFNETYPNISPDEKFVVFQAKKSEQTNIFVTDFPKADKQWQVSFGGGYYPQWIGSEIFFVNYNDDLMRVKVKTNPDFQFEKSTILFSADSAGVQIDGPTYQYTISPDGKNIIAVKNLNKSYPPSQVIVENWYEEFRNRKK